MLSQNIPRRSALKNSNKPLSNTSSPSSVLKKPSILTILASASRLCNASKLFQDSLEFQLFALIFSGSQVEVDKYPAN